MIIKLAWKNIWRNPTRSLVVIVAIILGLWAGSFIQSFYYGAIDQRVNDVIKTEISHLQMHHPRFNEDFNIAYSIKDPEALLDSINKMNQVKAVSQRSIATAVISSAAGSAGIKVFGVFPKQEEKITDIKNKIMEGHYFENSGRTPIVISQKIAKKLKLALRSKLVLTFTHLNGDIISAAFRVNGIYKTANAQYDQANVFVLANDLNKLAGISNSAHEIAVLLKSNDDLQMVKKSLQRQNPDLLVETWLEIVPLMKHAVEMMDRTLAIFIFIILLAVMFGIVNTMLMSILERYRELGILMAIGMNKVRVFYLISAETIFLSMIGTPIGLFFGFLTIQYFKVNGINMGVFSEAFANIGYSSIIFPRLDFINYLRITFQVFFVSIFAAFYPALKALSLKPIDAIRKI